jgi:hypothetical protein
MNAPWVIQMHDRVPKGFSSQVIQHERKNFPTVLTLGIWLRGVKLLDGLDRDKRLSMGCPIALEPVGLFGGEAGTGWLKDVDG